MPFRQGKGEWQALRPTDTVECAGKRPPTSSWRSQACFPAVSTSALSPLVVLAPATLTATPRHTYHRRQHPLHLLQVCTPVLGVAQTAAGTSGTSRPSTPRDSLLPHQSTSPSPSPNLYEPASTRRGHPPRPLTSATTQRTCPCTWLWGGRVFLVGLAAQVPLGGRVGDCHEGERTSLSPGRRETAHTHRKRGSVPLALYAHDHLNNLAALCCATDARRRVSAS